MPAKAVQGNFSSATAAFESKAIRPDISTIYTSINDACILKGGAVRVGDDQCNKNLIVYGGCIRRSRLALEGGAVRVGHGRRPQQAGHPIRYAPVTVPRGGLGDGPVGGGRVGLRATRSDISE